MSKYLIMWAYDQYENRLGHCKVEIATYESREQASGTAFNALRRRYYDRMHRFETEESDT